MTPCKHCGKNHANRHRGLCWHCYYTPGVKARYPMLRGSCWQMIAVLEPKDEPEPTDTLPGTPERLAVLDQRASARQQLWHPDDAQR